MIFPKSLVIIPTYNEKDNIPLIIPEVLKQDPCLEVLVVDDGSPDGTGEPSSMMEAGTDRGMFCSIFRKSMRS